MNMFHLCINLGTVVSPCKGLPFLAHTLANFWSKTDIYMDNGIKTQMQEGCFSDGVLRSDDQKGFPCVCWCPGNTALLLPLFCVPA